MDGSRSGGLLAATWAAMVALGRDGYRERARDIFETSYAMQEAVRSHPELRFLGKPSFLFSFTSDAFDVYHVNDFMRTRGWRFNGQQYPNALHMAVTGPQTQPGIVDEFAKDLADGVAYAREQNAAGEAPQSAAIYGGFPGGRSAEADELIRGVMTDLMDRMQALPA
jgi:glutamate/tyrosine decarboxylase-like PLP-dependent enzyme